MRRATQAKCVARLFSRLPPFAQFDHVMWLERNAGRLGILGAAG